MIQNVWYQRFKRKELLEKAEQCGEEIKKFQNVLEQGSKQRDKVVKSKVPTHLYKILWKAYLRDVFYKNKFGYNESLEILYDDLPELLFHWPYEEFILKEVLPNFPPKLNDYNTFFHSNYGDFIDTLTSKIAGKLKNFHAVLVKTVSRCCLFNNDGRFKERHQEICKIRKIGTCMYLLLMLTISQSQFDWTSAQPL